jgi:formylglycine-generating enzyme required for sulfatase activity
MGRTEVTVAAYKKFVRGGGRSMPRAPSFNAGWEKEDHPIVNVPWEAAAAFCSGAGARLPREDEWEFAARGGHSDWFFPWGTQDPVCRPDAANGARFDDGRACQKAGTEKVAAYKPNGYGLYDMGGNAWEWCQDLWTGRDREAGDSESDTRPRRVMRGGSWINEAWYMRVSIRSRWYEGPSSRDFVGFRCVLDHASRASARRA